MLIRQGPSPRRLRGKAALDTFGRGNCGAEIIPDRATRSAYFGQKDAQQAAVITRMVTDFNLPMELRILPTIRERDGLAMSSRNAYLDLQERAAATVLYRALQAGRRAFEAYPNEGLLAVTQAMTQAVLEEPRAQLEYAEVETLTALRD